MDVKNMPNKVIHYCWFGGNPLSDLTKKCIESWKKFLPDFEIKEWNETNFDVNSCKFIKQAYEQKKWAFVADYTRFKVLEQYGGLYLDTDMEITKDISKYLEHDLFLGVEDSKMINAAVVWSKEKENKHIKNIINIYESMEEFNPNGDLYEMSVPRVLTKYFTNYGFEKENDSEIQVLDNESAYIYPMEYFYPLSYDHQHNKFTDKSCMIHHFDATWISKMEKFKTEMKRKNMKWVVYIIDFFINSKNRIMSFINYKDISIFLASFLVMFFSLLAFTPIQEKVNGVVVVGQLIFSIIWTIICKQIRTIEINELLDINLVENKDNDYKKSHINDERKTEILRYENKVFGIQCIFIMIFMLPFNLFIIHKLELTTLFLGIALLLFVTMIYVGIKKEFKYRILDLLVVAISLAYMLTYSLGIAICAILLFALTLALTLKHKLSKKRIIVFLGAFLLLTGLIFGARFISKDLDNFNSVNMKCNNIVNFETINNIEETSEILNSATKFEYFKNILLNINEFLFNNAIFKYLLSPTVCMYISLIITIFMNALKNKKIYILLSISTILYSFFAYSLKEYMIVNYLVLIFMVTNLFVMLLRKIYHNDKIRLN